MRKFYLILLILCFLKGHSQSSEEMYNKFVGSGGIVCFYVKKDGSQIQNEVNMFIFMEDKQEVVKILDNSFAQYKAKLDRTYIEQGLIIKEYTPTQFLNNPSKRIYRFCYEEDSKEPIVVLEIVYTTKDDYVITKYFTSEWAKLSNYKTQN
ncbi:hypothetical protein PQ459_02860 [Chryseobacterium sp. KACC 21268]|nr:hypothetical protein PQ459_02860 [Chryseobacterium sp. KACC 21268]